MLLKNLFIFWVSVVLIVSVCWESGADEKTQTLQIAIVKVDGLQVRSAPSKDALIFTKIQQNTTVQIVEMPASMAPWVRIGIPSSECTGWVYGDYLAYEGKVEKGEPTSAVPITIGVCMEDFHVRLDPGNPKVYVLIPLAAYYEGTWMPETFFSMLIPGTEWEYTKTFKPKQDVFLESLLGQTFYSCLNPTVKFKPEKKVSANLGNPSYLGMHGVVEGVFDDKERFPEVAMTNVREIFGSMQPGVLSPEVEKLLTKRMPKLLGSVVRAGEDERTWEETRPTFDVELYQPPTFRKVILCSLPTGWEGLWVEATLFYPAESSPSPVERSIGGSYWSGYYYALLDPKAQSEDPILWENTCIPGFSGDVTRTLLAVFDADTDDEPELLFEESDYCESYAYKLKHFGKRRLVDICSLWGGI